MLKQCTIPRPFVVLFLGRSGSTFLVQSLRSHLAIRVQGEKIAEIRNSLRQNNWARSFLTQATSESCLAQGFKCKLKDVIDPGGFRDVLSSTGAFIVHLERLNKVKQAISWIRADMLFKQTGVWNLARTQAPLGPVKIDEDDLACKLELLEEGSLYLNKFVSSLDLGKHYVTYEELLATPSEALNRIFDFLGVTPQATKAECSKNTDDDLRKSVTNFDVLRRVYCGTVYELMFDEILISSI